MPWTRWFRRGLACAIVILCGALLGGCTPKPTLIIAVYLANGHPAIVVRPCQGHVYEIVLGGQPPQAQFGDRGGIATSPSPYDSDRFWHVEDPDRSHPVTEARLLEMPTGW